MNEIKNKFKAIIFDLDGTIIDTGPIWQKVMVDVLSHYGISKITPELKKILKDIAGIGLFESSNISMTSQHLFM